MQIFKQVTKFNFMGKRLMAMVLSLLLIAASIGALATKGLNFGVDFTGGAVIEVGYSQPTELAGVRAALSKDFGDAQVQHFGASTDVLIRMAPREGISSVDLSKKVLDTLKAATESVPAISDCF